MHVPLVMQLICHYNKIKGKQSYCDVFATVTLINQQKYAVFVFTDGIWDTVPPKKMTISTIEKSCDLQGIQKYQTQQCLPKSELVWCLDLCDTSWTPATLGLVWCLDSCNAWFCVMLGLLQWCLDLCNAWTHAMLGLIWHLDLSDAWTRVMLGLVSWRLMGSVKRLDWAWFENWNGLGLKAGLGLVWRLN